MQLILGEREMEMGQTGEPTAWIAAGLQIQEDQ